MTSIGSGDHLPALRIHPNPADDVLFLDIPSLGDKMTISIHNILGTKVYETWATPGIAQLDVSKFTPGLYIITLVLQDNFSYATKIVIK